MKLVFMGTPDFAETALRALFGSRHEVAAVYTQPDKPVGRKAVLTPPPVKTLAQEHGVPVFQPTKLRDGTVAAQLREIAPDVIVVVAYGRILPPDVLAVPRLGCINVHASLLPSYRGAAPIEAAVVHGESVTGVTTMYMAEGLDTGDMILRAELPIGEDEQAPELRPRLAELGASLLLETLDKLERGDAPRIPQDERRASWASIIKKEDARVDFGKTAREVHNLVRGMAGWPCAYCACEGKMLKIHRSKLAEGRGEPGEVLDGKKLVVACKDGAVELLEVQMEGAKRVSGADFLRGHRVKTLQ